ncbi:nucleotide exchange factor GrpE [Sandarakinorhabdus sp.]|uniref:nucleotide exchange factor GrpE n=1 Tax=Sandarakinorhabdus sp. TaxID=1916663 RepID=UPI00286DD36F|nr:nucleotide exchange factor GrpE [Sandarakinorhabdus sp.]
MTEVNDAPQSPFDDLPEDAAGPDAEAIAEPNAEAALLAALDARDAEITDLKDRVLRAAAETENTRRRLERDKADTAAYAMTGFARDLLAVADNMRRAVAALPAAGESAAVDLVRAGIEATERELIAIFGRYGVTRIETEGQKLDPNRHQAMLEVPSDAHEPGSIVAELQAGYVIKDRLLRPALVSVAKAS